MMAHFGPAEPGIFGPGYHAHQPMFEEGDGLASHSDGRLTRRPPVPVFLPSGSGTHTSSSLPCGLHHTHTRVHGDRRRRGGRRRRGMVGSAAYSATSIVVVMAKDKGRGSKGAKGGASSGQVSDRRPAPRITSNVKHNLRILKFWKDYERKQTTGRQPATRFRKKKVMKDVLPDDTDFYEDPSATLTCTNDGLEIASPVILVDGYNVCGYWGKLKGDFLNGNQGIARQMLIDELVSFSAVREIKVVVVFDAALSGHPTHTETYRGVDVVYSADLSADCWIEKEVEALVADGCPKVWVVTSDVLEQQLSHGEGALIWSSKRLVKEIKESEQELDEELKETRSTSLQGKIFQNKLKPKVVQSLKALRNRLEEQERRKK